MTSDLRTSLEMEKQVSADVMSSLEQERQRTIEVSKEVVAMGDHSEKKIKNLTQENENLRLVRLTVFLVPTELINFWHRLCF